MRRNTKGQALIEFILILPILLILTIGVFDLFNIQNKKYDLENDLEYIKELYMNNNEDEINTYLNKNDITLEKNINGEFIELKLTRKVKLITPLLNKVLDNPTIISVKRSVLYE